MGKARWMGRITSSKAAEYGLILLLFVLLAVLFTWPMVLHINDGLLGQHGDPLQQSWIISWGARTTFSHPTQLFQANIYYPSGDSLIYSEHMFTLGLIAAPLYHLSGNPILAYNFLVLLGFILSGFGCYLLIKELTGSRWGGLAGGIFFAFCPYKISELNHLNILFSAFLPFVFLYLYRFLGTGRILFLVLFAVFFLAQSLSSWHYLIFLIFSVGLLLVWEAIFKRGDGKWLRLGLVMLALIVVMAVIIPFALPYLRAYSELPDFGRELQDAEEFSASAGDYLRVLPENMLYGGAPLFLKPGYIGSEMALFPGFVVFILALCGIFVRRREDDVTAAFSGASFREGATFFLVLAIAGFLLTFGPEIGGVSNPLYTIPHRLFLFRAIRAPVRFYILFSLGIAVLAGYGAAKLTIRASGLKWGLKASRLAGVGIVVLLFLELATFNLALYDVPVKGEIPEVYRWLEDQDEVEIIELPTSPLGTGARRYDWDIGFLPVDESEYFFRESLLMYLSTYHWKDMVNGHASYIPYSYRRIMTEMQAFPSERTKDLVRALDLDYVIWHLNWQEEARALESLRRLKADPEILLVRDFGSEVVLEITPGERGSISNLEAGVACPASVPAGEGFNFAMLTRNTGDGPLVISQRDRQRYSLTIADSSGDIVFQETGGFPPPFFLQGGGTAYVPLQSEGIADQGRYRLEMSLEDGVPHESVIECEFEVVDPETISGPGFLNGEISQTGDGQIKPIPETDGLYPMQFEVRNTGDIYWRSDWENLVFEGEYAYGLVVMLVTWKRAGGSAWEEQVVILPCDLSPEQAIDVPFLVRPPDASGIYELRVELVDADRGPFGQPWTRVVKIGE